MIIGNVKVSSYRGVAGSDASLPRRTRVAASTLRSLTREGLNLKSSGLCGQKHTTPSPLILMWLGLRNTKGQNSRFVPMHGAFCLDPSRRHK